MNLPALRPAASSRRIRSADKRADAITAPPAPASAVDAIRAAVRPAGRPATSEQPDVETVREAIRGGSTRRTVVRTGVWSVPVVAAAVAAPAFAASPNQICGICQNSGIPVRCTIGLVVGQPVPAGQCACGNGLVCVQAGPLGIQNVCVGASLTNPTNCGGTTCQGVCLADGSTLLRAVDALITGLTAPLALVGCGVNQTSTFPRNVCVNITNGAAGNLGSLCIPTVTGGVLSGILETLVATLTTVTNAVGLGPARSCATGLSCQGGARVTTTQGGLGLCGIVGQTVQVGFCQCPVPSLP